MSTLAIISALRSSAVHLSAATSASRLSSSSSSSQPDPYVSNKERRNRIRKEQQQRININYKEIEKEKLSNLPDFQKLIRELYKKAHPDILYSTYPKEASVNDASMQILNGIITTLKSTEEYPQATRKKIPFYMKGSTSKLECRHLDIRIGGGYCKKQLTKSFEAFFADCGIHRGSFNWNSGYFPFAITNSLHLKREDEEKDNE